MGGVEAGWKMEGGKWKWKTENPGFPPFPFLVEKPVFICSLWIGKSPHLWGIFP